MRFGDVEGFALGALPTGLEPLLASWAERGTLDDATQIKSDRVWRAGSWAIKRFDGRHGLLERLRDSPARRCVQLHKRIAPVPSPAPVCVLERPSRTSVGAPRESLLVSEFIDGRFLHVLWNDEPDALAALPGFVAAMHHARVFHGDLHAGNMIWSGVAWYLIDLDGLRHRLRTLFPRRLILDHWGRLYFGVGCRDDLRPLFDDYLERMGLRWERDRAWRDVQCEAQHVCETRLGPGSWPGPRPVS